MYISTLINETQSSPQLCLLCLKRLRSFWGVEVISMFLDLVLLDKKSAAEIRMTLKTMLMDSERRQALIQEIIKTNNHLKWATWWIILLFIFDLDIFLIWFWSTDFWHNVVLKMLYLKSIFSSFLKMCWCLGYFIHHMVYSLHLSSYKMQL